MPKMPQKPVMMPVPPKVIRDKRCETCGNSEPNGNNLECHARPPAACIIPTPNGPLTISAFPVVRREQWCRADWCPKIELASGNDAA